MTRLLPFVAGVLAVWLLVDDIQALVSGFTLSGITRIVADVLLAYLSGQASKRRTSASAAQREVGPEATI